MMRSPACEMFGIETPIFAFSHCRDVVVEASRAGGLGVLGTAHFTLEELKRELDGSSCCPRLPSLPRTSM